MRDSQGHTCIPNTHASIMSRIYQELYHSGGRNEACTFAIRAHADPDVIATEIATALTTIQTLLDDNPHGSMAAGASPRLYKDGYIAGLRDILQIIEQTQATRVEHPTQPYRAKTESEEEHA